MITQNDVDFYKDQCYLVVKDVVSEPELAALRSELVSILNQLIGPGVRFQIAKLNVKSAGEPTLIPRLESVPVRLPLPEAPMQGSIYENQRTLQNRYFEVIEDGREKLS